MTQVFMTCWNCHAPLGKNTNNCWNCGRNQTNWFTKREAKLQSLHPNDAPSPCTFNTQKERRTP